MLMLIGSYSNLWQIVGLVGYRSKTTRGDGTKSEYAEGGNAVAPNIARRIALDWSKVGIAWPTYRLPPKLTKLTSSLETLQPKLRTSFAQTT